MKSTLFVIILLTLLSCTKTSTTKNSSSSSNNASSDYCTQNPMGYGCPQYCTYNPTSSFCSGTTTGTTSGGTTTGGGTTGSTTGAHSYSSIPSDNNWGSLYPTMPSGYCSTPTGDGYDLRRGTITIAGGTMYSPANAWSSVGEPEYTSTLYTHNNSSFLVNVNEAKNFLDSDGRLKVRVKIRPQPKPPVGKSWCFNRVTGQSGNTYGYKNLNFAVSLRGVNSNGTLKSTYLGTQYVSASVNGCSPTIDFTGINQSNPDGVVVVIHSVNSDQGCWYSGGCTAMTAVKAGSCWSMDIEVATDTTKDI